MKLFRKADAIYICICDATARLRKPTSIYMFIHKFSAANYAAREDLVGEIKQRAAF